MLNVPPCKGCGSCWRLAAGGVVSAISGLRLCVNSNRSAFTTGDIPDVDLPPRHVCGDLAPGVI